MIVIVMIFDVYPYCPPLAELLIYFVTFNYFSPFADLCWSGKPEIIFVGNLHGNDAVGQGILLNLIEYLCSNYGSEPLITHLMNSTRVHILPSMNPDGYNMVEEGTCLEKVKGHNIVLLWIII